MPEALIGREHPASVIRTEVGRLLSGRGGLVFVTGEAGIGKTSLMAEAADDAARRGARVLSASCWEGGGAPGYWPWVQVVRDLARTATTAEWAAVSGTAGDSLPVLLGEAAPPSASARPDSDNVVFRLQDAFTTLLVGAARSEPTMVVLDDLHWADPASLRLLDFLSRHAWFEPLLVLGAYRDVEVEGPDHPARELLLPLASRARTIGLSGLDPTEVGALIERTTGTAPEAGLAAEVHRRTGGNPFFVEQTAQLGSPVGAGVRDAVRRRLDLLPPEALAVLTTASVIGHEFTEGLLAAVRAACPAADDPGDTAALLEPALAARLVSRAGGDRYRFTHDLVRESLYEALGAERRRESHLAVVRANGRQPELSPAALAHHGRLAVPLLPGPEAVDLLLAAARHAGGRLASEEAVGHYRDALRIIGDAPDRPWVELELAEQLDRAGDLSGARESFAAALDAGRAIGDAVLVARAALGLHRLGNPTHRGDDQIALMDEARAGLDRAPGLGDASLRARILAAAGMARAHRGVDQDTAQALSRAAVTLAREAGDDATLGWCLLALHDAIWIPGADADRIRVLDELTAAARRAGDGELESLAAFLRALALLEQGSPRGRDELEAFTALAERTRLPRHRYLAVSRRGALAALEGRFAEARRAIDEARLLGERVGEVDRLRVWRDQVWILELLRGETEQALAVARTATPGEPFVAALEGLAAAHVGDAETAARHFPEAERLLEGLPPRFGPMLMVYRARLAALTGDPEMCDQARRAIKPVVDRWAMFSGGMILGPMSMWVGDVDAAQGLWDDAIANFSTAADTADRLGARPWAVLARARLARALRARVDRGQGSQGDADRAAAVLAEARAEAARIGMVFEEPAEERPVDADHVFRLDGRVWTLRFEGRTTHMPDAKGLRDLRVLLRCPGVDVPATELLAPGAETAGPGAYGADPVLDEQARNAYRERLLRLDDDLERAEARGDERWAAALDREREALLDELRRATGLGGRPRRLGDDAERARQTVTARIRDVLRKLRETHPELHAHLAAAVTTGKYCGYRPETPIRWSF